MLVYLAEKDRFVALDYKEMAPAAARRNMYILPDGSVDKETVRYTRKGFGVPGTVAAFAKALKEDSGNNRANFLLKWCIRIPRQSLHPGCVENISLEISLVTDIRANVMREVCP